MYKRQVVSGGSGVAARAQATTWAVVLANAAVWAAWQLPYAPLRAALERWFLSSAVILGAGFPRGWASALLCTYSHSSFLHLAANMAGLLSFGPRLMQQRPSQRTPRLAPAEFMALYTAAGALSSVGSSLFMGALGSARPARRACRRSARRRCCRSRRTRRSFSSSCSR